MHEWTSSFRTSRCLSASSVEGGQRRALRRALRRGLRRALRRGLSRALRRGFIEADADVVNLRGAIYTASVGFDLVMVPRWQKCPIRRRQMLLTV